MHSREFNSEKAGRRQTSISLEDAFWTSLRQIARGRQMTISDLIASLDGARENSNLSSAIRVFILYHYLAMAGQSDVGFTNRPKQEGLLTDEY
jgi:predicted DNA-binding ribbon-helix-helix protein